VLRETDPQAGLTLWRRCCPSRPGGCPRSTPTWTTSACWRRGELCSTGGLVVPRSRSTRCCGCCTSNTASSWATSASREVADSIGWRRFCRLGLDQPVPHPTTLVKLVRRAGPEVIEQLNQALRAKLAADKVLRVNTTVVEADIDYPTDADLLEQAVRKVGGLVRRSKAYGAASRTRFRDRGRAAGRRMRQLAPSLRRRGEDAMAEVDRLTGEVAGLARRTLREVQAVVRNARRALGGRPHDGRLGRLVSELEETIGHAGRLLWQTDQRLGGNRVIPDRLVSLADPDARPICKGKPRSPTEFGYTLLVAEDERGFLADHQLQQGNPPDAP
jgi:transposase, IS5 family